MKVFLLTRMAVLAGRTRVVAELAIEGTEDDLTAQRLEFAAAFRSANRQLETAQGAVRIKTLETALWGWRWARVVNEVHGAPPGPGAPKRPGMLTNEQALAYCHELGLSTKIRANGCPSGGTTIGNLRNLAVRISTEDRLRELVAEYGSIYRIVDSLRESNVGLSGQELRYKHSRSSARQVRNLPKAGYSRFVPPQDWTSYLIQQGLTRGEISAALCISLEALGPEESFKLWDRANRPDRYTENRADQ